MYPGKDTIVPIGASLGAYKGQNWERKAKMETKGKDILRNKN